MSTNDRSDIASHINSFVEIEGDLTNEIAKKNIATRIEKQGFAPRAGGEWDCVAAARSGDSL